MAAFMLWLVASLNPLATFCSRASHIWADLGMSIAAVDFGRLPGQSNSSAAPIMRWAFAILGRMAARSE
ncbi:hypothetical protein EBX93_07455 [bacterium]|nr:hypothetical protein [bacterium]